MQAQIRRARLSEKLGWGRPIVCAVRDLPVYVFDATHGAITDLHGRVLSSRIGNYPGGRFALPGGGSLLVESGPDGWSFDGQSVQETWPTPKQRVWVSGKRIFAVRPEDDVLLFDFEGDAPPLDVVLMGFYIYWGFPTTTST